MKNVIYLALIAASLSACGTMIIKNPEDFKATEARNAPVTDEITASAAAPESDSDRVQRLIKSLQDGMHFQTGSAKLNPHTASALQELGKLVAKENAKIEIEGHADNTGTEKINQPLSIQRAKAVSSVLIRSGVPSDRISLKGYSSHKPIAKNTTEEGRSVNRRAAISLD
jgi:outer membrane protein OmpA-like peptidoglycan-associated protein